MGNGPSFGPPVFSADKTSDTEALLNFGVSHGLPYLPQVNLIQDFLGGKERDRGTIRETIRLKWFLDKWRSKACRSIGFAPLDDTKCPIKSLDNKSDATRPKSISIPGGDNKDVRSADCYRVLPASINNTATFGTKEALRALGIYVCSRCPAVRDLRYPVVISWIKMIDHNLVVCGWQQNPCLSLGSVVLLFLIIKYTIGSKVRSIQELKAHVLTCQYVCYAYYGFEISYPMRPFLTPSDNKKAFWDRAVSVTMSQSSRLLATNQDPNQYRLVLEELKSYDVATPS